MDQALNFGQTGKIDYPNGIQPVQRYGRQGDGLVSEYHGRYYTANLDGRLFTMDSDAVTLASANTTKGALATVKLINGFFNPLTSGVNAVLISAMVATTSGTPAGPYFYNFLADGTINSAATGTIRSLNLGLGSSISAMSAQTGVIVTNVAGGTTALKQLGTLGGPAASAVGAGLYGAFDEVAGRIIVPPGVLFGLTCVGAGTSHVVQSTLVWMEQPI